MIRLWPWLFIAFLGVFPLLAPGGGEDFYVSVLTKAMIYSIAATSLNLILGYGGMVSFGHAAYFGSASYALAILMREGIVSPWLLWTVPLILSVILSFFVGAIVLRTKGLYFIMITFAFAQMMYYVAISFKQYGGEDGLKAGRAHLPFLYLDDMAFYYVTLAALILSLGVLCKLLRSRFGLVLQASKENELRTIVLGYNVYSVRLIAFAISGALAGLAGMLMAQHTQFVTPYHLSWHFSGHLIMMVILGGAGRFWGGVLGAMVLSGIEELFQNLTIHWQLFVGVFMLAVAFFGQGGLIRFVGGRK